MAKKPHQPQSTVNLQRTLRACLAGTMLAAAGTVPLRAQTAPEGGVLKTLTGATLTGFVQASFFYNTQEPTDRHSDGYLWNTTDNSVSINKVKLTLATPAAEKSGTKWDAGYRLSLMFGEDATILNTGGGRAGLEDLREAFVDVNIPVGTGLNLKAGQLISLLNYESGDGGAANGNFSQGYQWYYTGNGPSAGVQLGYTFSDSVDGKIRVQNGLYAGALDGNNGKTVMASIGIKPDKATWISLVGFGGDESPTLSVKGGSILGGRQFAPELHLGFEFDYFNFNGPGPGSADLWSAGGWLTYSISPIVSATLRGEFLDDKDGGGIKGVGHRFGNSMIASPDANGDLSSVTLTLNISPTPKIKIQPEIRYDRTSYTGGFDGEKDRVFVGAGVTYSF